MKVSPLKEKNTWLANLRSQYMDLNKLPDNGTLSSMIPLHLLDLKKNTVDRCIYMKVSGCKFIFLILYVDDILLASSDLGILHETKKFHSKNFEMKDMDEATFVIGIEIFRDRSRGISRLSQKAYIERVLERFKMENYSASVALIQKGDKFNFMQCPQNDWNGNTWKEFLILLQ